jgi:hypothetical protein
MGKLVADKEADTGDHHEGKSDYDYDREHTAEVPTAQHQNRWPECKTQKNRERHRNKYFSAEIERSNGNDTDRQRPETRWWNTGWVNLDPVKAGCGVRHRRAVQRGRCGH